MIDVSDDSDSGEEDVASEVLSPAAVEEEECEDNDKPSEQLSAVELFVRSQEMLVEKKEAIRKNVEQLMEDPEGNVSGAGLRSRMSGLR